MKLDHVKHLGITDVAFSEPAGDHRAVVLTFVRLRPNHAVLERVVDERNKAVDAGDPGTPTLHFMDISALPDELQQAARIDENGEISWPDGKAAGAIEALTEAGHRVLGLDLRFYLDDGTFYEIPWSSSDADPHEAKADPLQALARIDDLERPEHAVERRVLVTWE